MNTLTNYRAARSYVKSKRHGRKLTTGLLIGALMISSFGQSLLVGLQALASTPPTVNSGVNLVVDSFVLTNASGTVKTSFAPNEAIYVRSAIRNNGSLSSKTGISTQYYAHQPSTVAVGTKNSPEISTTHGVFTVTTASNPFVYESRPNGARVTQFTSTKSFSQSTPGTYVARIFADANNIQGEPNETDNQRTVTYTISGTTTPPAANPNPVSGYNQVKLVPESFNLVNAAGQVKTSFAPNEPIYVQMTIANRGSLQGVENIMTQIYKNSPGAASLNSKDSPEFALLHGPFTITPANTSNLYQSTPGHWSLNRFYGSTRYFTQSTPGTYTARIFVDAGNKEPRDDKADNQLTATYTITGTTAPPPANPNPAPVPNYDKVKLVPESFNLVNASGQVKTTFAPNEPIYVQMTIANRGSLQGVENIMTQIYKNSPGAASLNTKDSPEFALLHGPFTITPASTTNLYQSTPGHWSLNRFYGSTRFFTQSTPGTYTARIFVDASNKEPRDNKADNQRTVTYTISGTPTTPPPTTQWPPNTVWPQPVQDPTGILAIVNKKFKLSSSYVPANLRTVNIPLVNNQPLRNDTATALEQMNSDALSKGIRMHLRSGYRSYSTQSTLYNNYVAQYGRASADTFSARPGHSEHQTGLAFDLGDRDVPSCDLAECFATTKSGKYVAQNAHRFGFIIRYPKGKDSITGYTYEPWHLRYLGVSAATNIYNSGKTMEEYYNVPGGGY